MCVFPDYPETFQTIKKPIQKFSRLSGLSGNFPDHPENIETIRELSRLSGNFPGYLETFCTIRKISSTSGNFPDNPKIFQTVLELPSAISRVTRKNFPDAQKLSGWQCHDAMMVFGTLPRLIWIKSKRTADFFFVRMSLRNNPSSEKNYNDFLFTGNLALVGFLLYEVY